MSYSTGSTEAEIGNGGGWIKNGHGGFRNTADTLYVQQTPKRFYQVFRRDGDRWVQATQESFTRPEDAKAYAEALS
jgi:hypothetical protein